LSTTNSPDSDVLPGSSAGAGRRAGRSGRLASQWEFSGRYGLVGAWFVVGLIFSLASPKLFLSTANVQNIFDSQAVLLVLTIGLLFPLTVGCFDASIAGILSVALMIVGRLNVTEGMPVLLAIAVALAVGVVIGLLNALVVIGFGVDSFVATLGMGTLLLGVAMGVSDLTLTGISPGLVSIVRADQLGVQTSFVCGLVLTVAAWYVLRFTPAGRYMQFIGANREVARLSGVRVARVQVVAYVISGLVAAFAGVLLAGVLGAADPNAGTSFLLPPFAAAFLGATAIRPGRFNAWGAFIAVYFLVTGISGLQIVGISGWVEQAFYGAALLVAVSLSRLSARSRR